MNIVSAAVFTGFMGDFLLQTGVKMGLGGPTGWGLKDYFALHGSTESLFIAGGMMSLFFALFPFPMTYRNLALYGVFLDLVFRIFMIFPSLKEYYEYFNYFWSAVWGIIPLCLVKVVSDL
jgi:hypothetical protein